VVKTANIIASLSLPTAAEFVKHMAMYTECPREVDESLTYMLNPSHVSVKLIHNEKLDPKYPEYVESCMLIMLPRLNC